MHIIQQSSTFLSPLEMLQIAALRPTHSYRLPTYQV